MTTHSKKLRAHHAATPRIEHLEARQLLAFSALVNFQPQGSQTPSGYKADTGAVFGTRSGGLSYGWNVTNNNAIDRNSSISPDQRYDTFAQMQVGGSFSWELAVPVGAYNVKLFAGDPISNDAFYHLFAETRLMINGAPSVAQRWIGSNNVVNVTDGRLTITSGPNAVNNKINFIEVTKAAPATPSNMTATTLSATQIRLNWQDNSINEDGFVVERSVNQSNNWTALPALGANVTTFTDTNLTPSTEYRYRVRSFNDVGSSFFYSTSAPVFTPMVPGLTPAAPSALVGTLNGNVVTLTWSDNSNNEDKFVIQKFGYNAAWTSVKEVAANQTSNFTYAASAQINQFRVVARNSTGGDSLPSNVLSVATRPEVPVYVNAQAASSSAIDITWDSVDSCVFHVERLVGNNWVRIATDLGSLNYRDTNLPAGTPQSYRVIAAAVNEAGESAPSDVVSATTAPGRVNGLAVTGVTTNSVSLRWDDVAGEAGYLVERSLDGVTWTLARMLFANETTYTDTGLQSGRTYLFRVTGFAYGPVPGERGDPVTATTLGGAVIVREMRD